MTVEAGIYAKLTGTPAVAALVGTRVYPVNIPQSATYPAITYQRISGPRVHSHDGASGLASPRFQFTCLATTQLAAIELAETVRKAIDGTTGIWGGVEVQSCILLDSADQAFELIPGSDEYFSGVRLDFEIWHAEDKA